MRVHRTRTTKGLNTGDAQSHSYEKVAHQDNIDITVLNGKYTGGLGTEDPHDFASPTVGNVATSTKFTDAFPFLPRNPTSPDFLPEIAIQLQGVTCTNYCIFL